MRTLGRRLFALLCLANACASRAVAPTHSGELAVEIVESAPVETSLNHKDIRDAKDVWLEMIDSSRASLDFAEFYASSRPGSSLEKIIEAIERAVSRGVRVRFLVEEKFYKTYPETLDRLAQHGIVVRRFDVAKLIGGVHHAKYFLVDRAIVFMGSQNFDWRSLEHVQELGVKINNREIARAFSTVFEQDWLLAGGEASRVTHTSLGSFPVNLDGLGTGTPVFSPQGWLPDESLWDLPRIISVIDAAQKSVSVQVLTYRSSSRDEPFPELEDGLKRAAERGVQVRLLVSNWSKRKGTIEGLQHLHHPPGLVVKFMNIPAWSGGFVPFARVVHAKYLVVDSKQVWIGTSNWERDYFYKSRNVGLLVESEILGTRLEQFFQDNWESTYSEIVNPTAAYEPPRIGE